MVNESRYAQRFAASIARVPPRCRAALERSSGCSAADRTRVPAGAASPWSCGCRISTRSGCRCCSGNDSAGSRAHRHSSPNSLERRALRGCAAIVVIGKEFVGPLRRMVPAPTPVHCIANWAPLSDLPVRPKVNPLSCRLGLDRRFVFLYSGTLGLKHDTELLLELGAHDPGLARHGARRVLRGTGRAARGRRGTRSRAHDHRVIEYQPYERLPELLGAADVLVAVLGRNTALHSVPSKVLTYHAAGPPDPCRDRCTELRRRVHRGGGFRIRRRTRRRRRLAECRERLHDDAALSPARRERARRGRRSLRHRSDREQFRSVLATAARREVVAPMTDSLVGPDARLLVVAAHADDEALGAGGTIARAGRPAPRCRSSCAATPCRVASSIPTSPRVKAQRRPRPRRRRVIWARR